MILMLSCKQSGRAKNLLTMSGKLGKVMRHLTWKSSDATVGLVFDRTNFYPEQGGQIYDTGVLYRDDTPAFEVNNVQSYAGYAVHMGKVLGFAD